MRILFVAPAGAGELATGAELARVASGNQIEICDGMVDRAKLESFLGRQFNVIHFAQHGGRGGLELSDGILESADLTSMLERQKALRLLFVNACDSVATGIMLHNEFHVPVVAHDAAIDDGAAVAFAETFYRALRTATVEEAFQRGLRTLQVRFPQEARTPQLINGDMASTACLEDLRKTMADGFAQVNGRMDALEGKVDALNDSRHWRAQLIMIGLLGTLVVAQVLTPVLNSWLMGGR